MLAAETVAALEVLVGTTSASLASDLRIAFDLAVAAADAAIENVRINTPSLADRTEAATITTRSEAALGTLRAQAQANRARVS
jgi:formiminotetrahydrofolate cyclodeaminase